MASDRFYYGGQAVIEGVMMRGRKTMATAVRSPGGGIAIRTASLSRIYTSRLRRIPFIRGVIVLAEALGLGMKALLYSASVSAAEEEETLSKFQLGLILTGSLAFAAVVFFIVPLLITRLFNFESSVLFNLVDGVIRVAFLVVYLKVIGLMPDIRRTFEYHGAEHATVNAYESGAPIELEAVRGHSKEHTRCGTSFMFVVMVISVLVFGVVGLHSVWLMALSRIVLIPVISAISYEVIYFGGRHSKNPFVRLLLSPGLLLQALTTRQPDDSQLEVAIAALRQVVDEEEGVSPPSQGSV